MTTYTNFYTNLASLEVEGVRRKLDYPPTQLTTSDLPAQWAQVPSGEEGPITVIWHGGYPEFFAEFIVAVDPTSQNILEDTYRNSLVIMDNLATALRNSAQTFAKGKVTFTIRKGAVEVGDHDYHAIIAEVTGHG